MLPVPLRILSSVVTGSVAVTVVWKWMFNNYYGIFNYLGKSTGLLEKNIKLAG